MLRNLLRLCSPNSGKAITFFTRGYNFDDLRWVVSTGVGRKGISFAKKNKTVMGCLAKGAYFLFPSVKTVVDWELNYFELYNYRRRHQSLDKRTPDVVYWTTLHKKETAA